VFIERRLNIRQFRRLGASGVIVALHYFGMSTFPAWCYCANDWSEQHAAPEIRVPVLEKELDPNFQAVFDQLVQLGKVITDFYSTA